MVKVYCNAAAVPLEDIAEEEEQPEEEEDADMIGDEDEMADFIVDEDVDETGAVVRYLLLIIISAVAYHIFMYVSVFSCASYI